MSTEHTANTADSMNQLLSSAGAGLDGERAALLETLAKHRMLLRHTVSNLSDEDARRRPTASALTLAGILKHVEGVERGWTDFIRTGVVEGAEHWTDQAAAGDERDDFALDDADTVVALLARYTETAAATDELVRTVDLDVSHELPPAPWFPANARWSARQALAHIVGETAQHSGHADIIRETVDGQKSMG
ncbi:DinB family protein [Pseudonocardia nematodicida]|uniref:DinB family protein n=1 Tax=Pseudonocardia nematodicida TaxID=1206997 RepID=A0ABV1KJK6_9PSEU